MACWVVPSVASEIWHVPVDQILAAVKSGKLASKQENGFTFVDVAPHTALPADAARAAKPKPVTYKVVRPSGPPESFPMPSPSEVVTLAEIQSLVGESPDNPPNAAPEQSSAMGDWRRGRRTATTRRMPPPMHAA